jgi:hypothetical protein
MLRFFAVVLIATCFMAPAAIRAQTPAAQPSVAAAKPAKKPIAAKAATPSAAETGPCDMRVISNTSDAFTVKKVGFTTFDTARQNSDLMGT